MKTSSGVAANVLETKTFQSGMHGQLSRLHLGGNVGYVYLWVRGPIFPKAVTNKWIDILDKNVVLIIFVKDVNDFARFCLSIIGVLYGSPV